MSTDPLPKTLKAIYATAFAHCSSLESITIPDSVEKINANAFYSCEKLATVTLGKKLTKVEDFAFENTALKSVYLPQNVNYLGDCAFGFNPGFFYPEPVNDFIIYCVKGTKADATAQKYKTDFGINYEYVSLKGASLKAGEAKTLKPTAGTVAAWKSSNAKIATVTKNGKVTALAKGTSTITATLNDGAKVTAKVSVKTNPKLSKSSVTVKKGKTVKVKITGKASSVKNVYTNTKIAKITSGKTADTITVKGLNKGNTILKIKVNGVTLKLKVKVK